MRLWYLALLGVVLSMAAVQAQAFSADLAVTLTASPNQVRQERELTYTLTIQNQGPEDAQDVVLMASLKGKGKTTLVRFDGIAPADCTVTQPGNLNCTLGDLANQERLTFTVVVKPTKTGTLTVTASVEAASPADPNAENDTATAVTAVVKK